MAPSIRGDRLADGAMKLARDYPKNIIWSDPRPVSFFGKDHRPFSDWLHSEEPLPQTLEDFRRFMSSTDMNCYQWVILAALRSAVIDRRTAVRYYDSFAYINSNDETAVVNAIYGANQPFPVNVEFNKDGREWNVKSVKGPGINFAQKGDIITFSGKHHVMIVVGKDAPGDLLVASFPTVVYGEVTDNPAPAATYVGTLKGFLQTNLDAWKSSADSYLNNFEHDKIMVGSPAFI
jgi:hypothetical protein